MVMKNKLSKHHRSKLAVVSRKISIAALSITGVFAIVALPTYISISASNKMEARAAEEKKAAEKQQLLSVEENEEA